MRGRGREDLPSVLSFLVQGPRGSCLYGVQARPEWGPQKGNDFSVEREELPLKISYVDAPKQTLHYLSWHHHPPKRVCVLVQFSRGKLRYTYTCTIPLFLGLAHFVLHVSSSLPRLRTSLKHPFSRRRCLRVLLLVLSKRRADRQIWMVGNDKWLEVPRFSDLGPSM